MTDGNDDDNIEREGPQMPEEGTRLYSEEEVQEILRRSGINKKMVAITVIAVHDNGEQAIQSFYHEGGLQVTVSKLGEEL